MKIRLKFILSKGYQIAKLLQPQYYLIGDRWNTFLNVQYDQIPTTKPIKPDSVKPTYEPEQIFQDTIIVAASSNLTSTPILTPTTTTTTKPKLKKIVKKNRLIRASEKPIFLRQEEAAPTEDETTTEKETETQTPEITTIIENLTETPLTPPPPPLIMNDVPNTDFTGYVYQKPTIQFDTPSHQSAYYDSNLIHDLNKFVPSTGGGELSKRGGYGLSTNNKIELISLTTSSYPPVSLDSFKPSSSDTFQNSKNYW